VDVDVPEAESLSGTATLTPEHSVPSELESLLQRHTDRLIKHVDGRMDRHDASLQRLLRESRESHPVLHIAVDHPHHTVDLPPRADQSPDQSPKSPKTSPRQAKSDVNLGSGTATFNNAWFRRRLSGGVHSQRTASRTTGGASPMMMESMALDAEDSLRKQGALVQQQVSDKMFSMVDERQRSRLSRMVYSAKFELGISMAIFVNSILIGAEVEYVAHHPGVPKPDFFFGCELVFTVFFFAELVCRLVVDRRYFFTGTRWPWNWFDTFIVVCSFVETAISIELKFGSDGGKGMDNISNFRLVRIFRITRVLRTVRTARTIRFISPLRTLVYSIMCTLKSLIWAMLLLSLDMYLFAIVFTEASAEHISTSIEVVPRLEEFWGSLSQSTFTLFKAISGGVSWHDAVVPLGKIQPFLLLLFVCYVAFSYFAVLNVVTGVFCHSAIETAEKDPDFVAQRLMDRRTDCERKLRRLFFEMDVDESGDLTLCELEKILTNRQLQAYFEAMGLDVDDAWALFKLMDKDKTNTIDIEEFVEACMRLRGFAKGIDIARLAQDNRAMIKKLMGFTNTVVEELKKMNVGHGSSPRMPHK